MELDRAQEIIGELAEGYNQIASHFAETRSAQWPIVEELAAQYITPEQSVLDMGCGAGRVAAIINDIGADYIGLDVSQQQITIAKQTYPENEFQVGSMTRTAFEDAAFNTVLLVASFHHIPSTAYRLKTLKELVRITKPGSTIVMTNWNLHQARFRKLRSSFRLQRLTRRVNLGPNDVLVPWKNQEGEAQQRRYYNPQ